MWMYIEQAREYLKKYCVNNNKISFFAQYRKYIKIIPLKSLGLCRIKMAEAALDVGRIS